MGFYIISFNNDNYLGDYMRNSLKSLLVLNIIIFSMLMQSNFIIQKCSGTTLELVSDKYISNDGKFKLSWTDIGAEKYEIWRDFDGALYVLVEETSLTYWNFLQTKNGNYTYFVRGNGFQSNRVTIIVDIIFTEEEEFSLLPYILVFVAIGLTTLILYQIIKKTKQDIDEEINLREK